MVLPMQRVLNIVPTTANNRIVPRWSKKGRFGIKYPASKMMGGSMQKKKTPGERGDKTVVLVQ